MSAARQSMTHRCTIERDGTSTTDTWGNPAAPSWATHLSALPCRAWFDAGREVVDGAKTAIDEDRRMIVPLDTDVTERDRIGDITDRLGNVLFDGPTGIEKVGRRRDHLVLYLEGVAD